VLPRIKNWQSPAGQASFEVVSFSAQLVGDKADLGIAAVSGKGLQQKVEIVGDFSLSVGDVITVTEVGKFGFEPITIRMVQRVPTPAGVPTVDNRTQSLRVTVSPAASTLPAFTFHLTNDSKMAALVVGWHTEAAGRILLSQSPQGERGEVLIEPGQRHDMTVRTDTSDDVAGGLTLVIGGVIFEDGTFEGIPGLAAPFRSRQVRLRTALGRLLPILIAANQLERIDIPSLISRIETFGKGAAERAASDPQVQRSSDQLTADTLGHLRRLQSTRPNMAEREARESLAELLDGYQKWFNRLSAFQ
jgi:hypothetical protein